jgi:predicted branched-subunit amino acid permease
MEKQSPRQSIFRTAFQYSVPVLLGYLAIGTAFGLLTVDAGYPWWLALVMSVVMYAGAGQSIAVGLFAAGTSLWEAALVQLVVNARHMAYGLAMLKQFGGTGLLRWYLIFGLTDETFALLSSLGEVAPEARNVRRADDIRKANSGPIPPGMDRAKFMCCVTALDQCYWVSGSVIGAAAGTLIPFSTEGISFALTALFVVLMIEQILRVRKPGIFIVSAIPAALGVIFLPSRVSLLAAMALALAVSSFLGTRRRAGV